MNLLGNERTHEVFLRKMKLKEEKTSIETAARKFQGKTDGRQSESGKQKVKYFYLTNELDFVSFSLSLYFVGIKAKNTMQNFCFSFNRTNDFVVFFHCTHIKQRTKKQKKKTKRKFNESKKNKSKIIESSKLNNKFLFHTSTLQLTLSQIHNKQRIRKSKEKSDGNCLRSK